MATPSAVIDLVATPGDQQVALSWTAPADGGFPITDYIVEYRPRGGWTPLDVPGLVGWWDASDASTITDTGGLVEQWDDKSGNARHLVKNTDLERPTTGVRTLNGLNVLGADNSFMKLSFTVSAPWTEIFVFDYESGQNLTGGTNDHDHRTKVLSGNLALGYRNDGSYDFLSTLNVGVGPHIIMTSRSSTGCYAYVDGVLQTFGNSTRKITSLTFPGRGAGVQGAAEFIVAGSQLGSSDRASVETYLADKWGITIATYPSTELFPSTGTYPAGA